MGRLLVVQVQTQQATKTAAVGPGYLLGLVSDSSTGSHTRFSGPKESGSSASMS